MSTADIEYFFNHEQKLPVNFESLHYKLQMMSKEGVIREEILDRYSYSDQVFLHESHLLWTSFVVYNGDFQNLQVTFVHD